MAQKFNNIEPTGDKIFFASDHHWGHKNIIKYSDRPFRNLEEMDRILIENWNATVPYDGVVYHLGDIFLSDEIYAKSIMDRLNGNISLINGNHEKTAHLIRSSFNWIKDYYCLKIQDEEAKRGTQEIILFHYAMRVWNKSHHGAYSLYGHSHGSLPDDPDSLSFDVGVDAIAKRLAQEYNAEVRPEYYRPVSYNEVKKWMKLKNWKPVDHHT